MLDDSTAGVHGPVLADAERIDRLAAPWLPLQGPKASDAERAGVQGELLEALRGLDARLAGGGYVGGGSLTFGDVVMLPAVLWLWQYVFGEDVKGGLANVGGWVGRMLEDGRVLAGVGMCAVTVVLARRHCIFSRLERCRASFGVTRCDRETYIYH